jgi:acyl-CoA oxidase
VQPFFVQIRDLQTRKPLPGVTVGDIGPKLGFSAKDNGFLRLDRVRVQRDNMLARYSKIDKRGNFQLLGNPKIGYATMLLTRLVISEGAPYQLSLALTIAIRVREF